MNIWLSLFVSSILNLDNVSAFQILISRPSFVGFIIGSINGFVVEGFIIGIMTELFVYDFVPIGGIPVPNGTIASTTAILLIPYFDGKIFIPFFIGLICGEAFSYIEVYLRTLKSYFNKILEKRFMNYKFLVGDIIFYSMLIDFLIYLIYGFLVYFIFSKISSYLNTNYLNNVFKVSMIGTFFIIMSSLFFKFKTQVSKNE
jgi:mannose/fructose/N-acetylgalactosamine-specific phosphotransferase system component IIC